MSSLPVLDDSGKEARYSEGRHSLSLFSSSHPLYYPHQPPFTGRRSPAKARGAEPQATAHPKALSLTEGKPSAAEGGGAGLRSHVTLSSALTSPAG